MTDYKGYRIQSVTDATVPIVGTVDKFISKSANFLIIYGLLEFTVGASLNVKNDNKQILAANKTLVRKTAFI